MAKTKKTKSKRPIESYEHKDKQRVNNPPVGLVTPATDPDAGAKKNYAYDAHLDPQLIWAGKAEHTSFEVPTVSLHVHERIDPRTIIEAVRRHNGGSKAQPSLFDQLEENPPLRDAIEFYKHAHGWSNRLVAGDSLLVMNSLLEKEGLAGKVQMIYIDPPYGITYRSNFQPFVNNREVKDRKDEDLTAEPEQICAFRDTWKIGIHSYLTYLRDRLFLARELLHERGSCFVQISDKNVHHVREIMDAVFGAKNYLNVIPFVKTTGVTTKFLASRVDFLVWYAREKELAKYHELYLEKSLEAGTADNYGWLELPDGTRRGLTSAEKRDRKLIPSNAKIYKPDNITSQGNPVLEFEYDGKPYRQAWKTNIAGLGNLAKANRLHVAKNTLQYVRYITDFPCVPITQLWEDTGTGSFTDQKLYVVQTGSKTIQRFLLMTTDPGDLVFDPTCGSGTTAYVAEQSGRRWITCDTSRVAITLAKQRLMTAAFDYYELAQPNEGVGSGFKYTTVPHVTLESIANNEPPATETLYNEPLVDHKKKRVSGPFTVEAVPAPAVKSVEELLEGSSQPADASIARSGETLRQGEWRDELLRAGIRGKGGQYILFARLEPLPGCRCLHADGETKEDHAKRVVVSFGPEHAPLEQRQVAQAIEEAQTLVPRPKLIVFAAFQFDPEAAKDIDETKWPGVTLLKAQMNADLLTDDLKKKRSSNESFWLIGQPDVKVEEIAKGDDKGKYRVSVHGFDYYNTKTGGIESGGADKIAMWLLDTDYDGRSLYPRQVFFPMAGESEGWAKLARNLNAEIDEERIEAYRGTASLPFEAGENRRIAVKIVDDRGIESLKVLEVG
jgi:adenine-specific DNA-methyltransferase